MTWYAWAMVAMLAVNVALSIWYVGKPRTPSTPGTALAVLVFNALFIWGIVSLAGVH